LVSGKPQIACRQDGAVALAVRISSNAGARADLLDNSKTEHDLIRAAQGGETRAFEALVRLHDQGVLRLAYHLLRSEEDARDIYQEAFLRVHRNLGSFRFDCSFHTWLYRIVTNLCLDLLRKRKVRKEELAPAAADGDAAPGWMEAMPENSAANNPERRLLSGELRERINGILEELSPRERTVFEMRHYQGLRLRQIGEMLGTTEEAAKNCLFRATQKMRAGLAEFA
jgi:RNA polymerase sigma-70 factor, ECF subfamily